MKALAELLNSFNLEIIFKAAYAISDVVAKWLSPVLLILAINIRLMETQLDSLTGSGKYGNALRDALGWGFLLGAYYMVGHYVIDFFNAV